MEEYFISLNYTTIAFKSSYFGIGGEFSCTLALDFSSWSSAENERL